MKNRRGEIATILMLGAVVVMGITAVISSFTQNDTKTTSSRASGSCAGGYCRKATTGCGASLYDTGLTTCDTGYLCCKPGTAPVATNTPKPAAPTTYKQEWEECTSTPQCDPAKNLICKKDFEGGKTCQKNPTIPPVTTGCSADNTDCTSTNCCKNESLGFACTTVSSSAKKCLKTSTPPVPVETIPPTSGAYDCNGKAGSPYPVDMNTQCSNYCEGIGSTYVKNSQGALNGQYYCCCGGVLPTNGPVPNPDGSNNDSCWLVKCKGDGSTDVRLYAQSLSAVGMPASSCSGGSAYGNGILVLNEQKNNFQCEGGAVVAIPPTAAPVDPSVDTGGECVPSSKGINCKTAYDTSWSNIMNSSKYYCCPAGVTPQAGDDPNVPVGDGTCTAKTGTCPNQKPFAYSEKNTRGECGDYCFGETVDSCDQKFSEIKTLQCTEGPDPEETPPPKVGACVEEQCPEGFTGKYQSIYLIISTQYYKSGECTRMGTNGRSKAEIEKIACTPKVVVGPQEGCQTIKCIDGKVGQYQKLKMSTGATGYFRDGNCKESASRPDFYTESSAKSASCKPELSVVIPANNLNNPLAVNLNNINLNNNGASLSLDSFVIGDNFRATCRPVSAGNAALQFITSQGTATNPCGKNENVNVTGSGGALQIACCPIL